VYDEVSVVFLDPLVLVLPLFLMLLVEVLLVLFHVLLENHLPPWLEVDLLDNLIRNVSDVKKNDDHVGLCPSLVLASNGHSLSLLTVDILFREAIFDQLFSLFDESADVVELLSVVLV